eukprot:scaffold64183_cov66-Attheya_sp.AAC.1
MTSLGNELATPKRVSNLGSNATCNVFILIESKDVEASGYVTLGMYMVLYASQTSWGLTGHATITQCRCAVWFEGPNEH